MEKKNLAIIGNICNVGYSLFTILEKEFNIRLYITYRNRKELDEFSDILKKKNIYTIKTNALNLPFKIRAISDWADIIHASTLSPIYSHLFKKKKTVLISHCHGADLTELSREKSILGRLLDRAYRNSKIIFYVTPELLAYLKEKNIQEKSVFLPNGIATPNIQHPLKEKSYTILVSANYTPSKKLTVFYEGFKWFQKKYPDMPVKLSIINASNNPDYPAFVESYISKNYAFMERQSRKKLYDLYTKADIIVDQFKLGVLGLNTFDPLARNKWVLAYFNSKYSGFYSSAPPILNARTPKEVFSALETFYVKKTIPLNNDAGSVWIYANQSEKKIKSIYLAAIQKFLFSDHKSP